ncbi:fatty-acid peroxygenase [Paramicrobacterium humi]|uniref:Fatty-acid peroxygenase n=1 Tax=Paramicrobacterium humi TaxID=640635 RepID=A0A1H4JEA1_9MICO|nr:cytochrome P450 [Microbacterium humi]SEB44541.1 fatty-acid peroxygenase [Microbacterium humi]
MSPKGTATAFPRAELDATAALLRDGYAFGTRRFDRLRTDVFTTRLLGRSATVVRGADAAEMFYGDDRFGRERSMPASVVALLQDEGSVQSLTGAEHHHRKSLFVRLLSDEAELDAVAEIFTEEWLASFRNVNRIELQAALVPLLTRTALRWVGIDPASVDVAALGDSLSAMIVDAGRFGPANWATRLRRRRVEEWATAYIESLRREHSDQATPAAEFALARDLSGALLPAEVAGIELINVLRPTVAIGRFIVFAALALHRSREWAEKVRDQPELILPFVQEVRRFFPFFPVIGGRALKPFTWRDTPFAADDWVVLDLYATNHDAQIWRHPEQFSPERFIDWEGDPYTLIPQGAGEVATGHRCPGERATIRIMCEAVRLLTTRTRYVVPSQRLEISLRTFPAAPYSGFIMTGVRSA